MNTASELERFCGRVLADAELQDALADPKDPEAFVALVVETALRAGLTIEASTLRSRLNAAQQANRLRWVDA